jgi:hypothetical protein
VELYYRIAKIRNIGQKSQFHIYIKRRYNMTDKMQILKQIKSLIFSTEEVVAENFLDIKVGDYILRVEADELAEGLPVFIVSEEGVMPAGADLAGEHVLEDGTKIVLDEAGIIVSIEKGEEPVEAPVEMPVEEEMAEEAPVEEVKEDVKDEVKEEVIAELMGRIEKLEAVVEEMMGVNKDVAEFSSAVKEKLDSFIKETPAELEFKSIKTEFKSDVVRNKEKSTDRLESIKNFRTKK